jgi:hypothetical protein
MQEQNSNKGPPSQIVLASVLTKRRLVFCQQAGGQKRAETERHVLALGGVHCLGENGGQLVCTRVAPTRAGDGRGGL